MNLRKDSVYDSIIPIVHASPVGNQVSKFMHNAGTFPINFSITCQVLSDVYGTLKAFQFVHFHDAKFAKVPLPHSLVYNIVRVHRLTRVGRPSWSNLSNCANGRHFFKCRANVVTAKKTTACEVQRSVESFVEKCFKMLLFRNHRGWKLSNGGNCLRNTISSERKRSLSAPNVKAFFRNKFLAVEVGKLIIGDLHLRSRWRWSFLRCISTPVVIS